MPKRAGAPTVRVAHEALITRWTRARDFVQDNAEALQDPPPHGGTLRTVARARGRPAWDAANASKSEVALRAKFAAWRARRGREPGLLSEIDLIDGQRLMREHRADTSLILIDYIERSQAADNRIRSRSVRVLALVAGVVTSLRCSRPERASSPCRSSMKPKPRRNWRWRPSFDCDRGRGPAPERWQRCGCAGHHRRGPREPGTPLRHARLRQSTCFRKCARPTPGLPCSPAMAASSWAPLTRPMGGASSPPRATEPRASGTQTPRRSLSHSIGDTRWRLDGDVFAGRAANCHASIDQTARIWDATTGKPLAVLAGHGKESIPPYFRPTGSTS